MPKQVNPLAMPAGDIVRLIGKAGCPGFSDEKLQELIESGLPLNADGTLNLLEFVAWLLKEVQGYAQPTAP